MTSEPATFLVTDWNWNAVIARAQPYEYYDNPLSQAVDEPAMRQIQSIFRGIAAISIQLMLLAEKELVP